MHDFMHQFSDFLYSNKLREAFTIVNNYPPTIR